MTTNAVGGLIPRTKSLSAGRRRPAKRVFDACVAVVLLCVLVPLVALAAALIRCTSRGPVIFRQTRVGRCGRPFTMYKFRTMRTGVSDDIHREYVRKLLTTNTPTAGGDGLFKLTADPRVTPVGRILRRTSIDELPQLINVLLGQMSLVGPRPALPWECEMFPQQYESRFDVRPGLTGLWQVSGRSRLTMRAGLDLDLEYVRRQSFSLDLRILARTVLAVAKTAEAS